MTNRPLALVFPFLLAACSSPSPTPSPSSDPAPKKPVLQTSAPVTSASVVTPGVATNAPTPVAKPQPRAEKLGIKRIVLARSIENKEPHDVSTTFNAKESKIYAFVEVENPEQLPGEVAVSFEPPESKDVPSAKTKKPTAEIKLAIGEGAHWRTWAFTRQAHEAGEWTAVVKDMHGRELGRQAFNVEL